MTAKQRAARAKFKAVVKEAAKLRKKNPKLTQAEAVKQAFAISYSKQRKGKKLGATSRQTGTSDKLRDKARKAKPPGKRKAGKTAQRKYYYEYRKNRTDKPGKLTGTHKDTKSHNVNIRVVSGIDDQMTAIRNNLEKSIDYYMSRVNEILNSYGRLEPKDKILAKKIIKRYKTYVTKLLKQLRETNQIIAQNTR